MSEIVGSWRLRMKTPIGTIDADYRFVETAHGITGIAGSAGEEVALTAIVETTTADGAHVTWRQRITRPLRLNLEFDVIVVGDALTGHSRAGRLPRSSVTGSRQPEQPPPAQAARG